MDFFLGAYHMVLTHRWILVAPDLTSVFGEGFPPLYKRGFKVDESKHPTLCIHRLIEPMENYSRVKFGITDKWHNTITSRVVTIFGPQGQVCVCCITFNQLNKSFSNCVTGLSRTNKQILYLHIHPRAFVVVVVRGMTVLTVMISMFIERAAATGMQNPQREHKAVK